MIMAMGAATIMAMSGGLVDSQVPNWEDVNGISTDSLSEDEEKTIKVVYEQMKDRFLFFILILIIKVEGTFPDGTKLITDPVSCKNGNREMALHGSFLPVPSFEKFPVIECCKIPGELIFRYGYILLNSGREAVVLKVGSHYHFIEVNPSLIFDRRKAYGMRLNIPAGTARFEVWFAERNKKTYNILKSGL
ncbi:hypothetical protein L2E82_01951 [Cichorium intybus]|uniref:Uncharacterized protein n=1 Tax=Cichorium intybus TaxID=13427 RepID=A0ACB9H2F8_CICIN|nr:hypothetical protein L2E82_01951 [Cichorium intybus]